MLRRAALILFLLSATPSLAAGASNYTLVNGTGRAIGGLSIKRAGASDWKPLAGAPSPGASSAVSFSDPDCAFDIRANNADGQPITWAGVNLCGAKSVTLRKDESAGAWVDYDQ